MVLIAAILVFLGFTALLYWAFEADQEWRIKRDDEYVITSLWRERR